MFGFPCLKKSHMKRFSCTLTCDPHFYLEIIIRQECDRKAWACWVTHFLTDPFMLSFFLVKWQALGKRKMMYKPTRPVKSNSRKLPKPKGISYSSRTHADETFPQCWAKSRQSTISKNGPHWWYVDIWSKEGSSNLAAAQQTSCYPVSAEECALNILSAPFPFPGLSSCGEPPNGGEMKEMPAVPGNPQKLQWHVLKNSSIPVIKGEGERTSLPLNGECQE